MMPAFKSLFIVSMLSLACQSPARGLKLPPSPALSLQLPVFERHVLSNGMEVVFLKTSDFPLVQGSMSLKAGSVLDPAGKEGLASLVAGLLRQGGAGSLGPAAFDQAVEEKAASLDAAAEREQATADFRCLAGDLDLILGLYADMLRRPAFDTGRLEIARQSMLDGLSHEEDTPDSLTQILFVKALYGHHPYGRWANPQSVAGLTRQDVVDFFHRHYAPGGTVLTLAGQFDGERVLARLESLFKGWPAGAALPEFSAPKPLGPAIYFYPKQVSQVYVRLGYQGLRRHDPREYALNLANYVLGGSGFASRLMSRIRSDRGLAYFVYSLSRPGDVPGIYEVQGGTRPQTLKEYLTLMFGILREFEEQGPSAQELDQAKQSILEQFATQFESPFSEATYQGQLDFHGYPADYLAAYRDHIRAVTLEEAVAAAHAILSQQDWVLVVCGPAELKDTLSGFGKVVEVHKVFSNF